jgi:hypothetical protein
VPKLPRGQGLIVEQIGADLPKTLGKLSRFDVLLSYDGHPINSIEQFNQLVLNAKPDQKRPLVVLRGGKEVKLEVNLHASELKGAIKPGGPPAVSMECTFLDGGKMQIQMQYYSESSSKLETVTCNGSLPEIEQQVRNHKLPSRVEDLVDVALKRLKAANVK